SGTVTWSDEMFHIYGYDDQKFPVTFEKATERMEAEEAELSKQRIKDHIEEGLRFFHETGQLEFNTPPVEYIIVLPGGTKKNLRGVGKIIFTKRGEVSKVVGTVQ